MIFNGDVIFKLFSYMQEYPAMCVNILFSFFGHYGVQLFIFISGYGLMKKYMHTDSVSYRKYLPPILIRLYSLLIFGIITFIIIYFATTLRDMYNSGIPLTLESFNEKISFQYIGALALSSLLMINNISYARIFLFVGPWWYFSLAMQLYLIFPLLHKFIKNNKPKIILLAFIACYAIIYILLPWTEKIQFPIFGNFIGNLPVFMFGMALAKLDKFQLNWKILLAACILFALSFVYQVFYPFIFISITIILLYILYPIYSKKNQDSKPMKILLFIGKVSTFIFVINGPLRVITVPYFQEGPLLISIGAIVQLALSIGCGYLLSIIYDRSVNRLLKKYINT